MPAAPDAQNHAVPTGTPSPLEGAGPHHVPAASAEPESRSPVKNDKFKHDNERSKNSGRQMGFEMFQCT